MWKMVMNDKTKHVDALFRSICGIVTCKIFNQLDILLVSLVLMVQCAVSLNNSRAAAVRGMTDRERERVSQIRNTVRVSQRVFPIMHLVLRVTSTLKPAGAARVDIGDLLLHTNRLVSWSLWQISHSLCWYSVSIITPSGTPLIIWPLAHYW